MAVADAFIYVFMIVIFFFTNLSLIFTGLQYLGQLQKQLKFSNSESVKLLDGMHEGLLIVRKKLRSNGERSVMFCNTPAKKIIAGFGSLMKGKIRKESENLSV